MSKAAKATSGWLIWAKKEILLVMGHPFCDGCHDLQSPGHWFDYSGRRMNRGVLSVTWPVG